MSMKQLFFIVGFSMCAQVFAQSGVYVNEPKNFDGTIIKWTLTLNEDGTFLYHFLRDLSAISKPNKEENFYGKGTWKSKKNLVFLSSNKETDFNERYTIDLNNSKARYINKSPRDESDRVVKPALIFYESHHIKGLKLFEN